MPWRQLLYYQNDDKTNVHYQKMDLNRKTHYSTLNICSPHDYSFFVIAIQ